VIFPSVKEHFRTVTWPHSCELQIRKQPENKYRNSTWSRAQEHALHVKSVESTIATGGPTTDSLPISCERNQETS